MKNFLRTRWQRILGNSMEQNKSINNVTSTCASTTCMQWQGLHTRAWRRSVNVTLRQRHMPVAEWDCETPPTKDLGRRIQALGDAIYFMRRAWCTSMRDEVLDLRDLKFILTDLFRILEPKGIENKRLKFRETILCFPYKSKELRALCVESSFEWIRLLRQLHFLQYFVNGNTVTLENFVFLEAYRQFAMGCPLQHNVSIWRYTRRHFTLKATNFLEYPT